MRKTLLAVGLMVPMMAAANANPFAGAQWIGEDPAPSLPVRKALVGRGEKRLQSASCPVFATTIDLGAAKVKKATAHVTGLGFYDLRVNGDSSDPMRMMTPAWTCPDWRVYYDKYEVTSLLRPGENRVTIQLAGGYDDGVFAWNWRWLGEKRTIFAMEVTFDDGTTRRLVTDGSWKWTADDRRVSASLYDGETYDATRDPAKATWRSVKPLDDAGLKLVENPGPGVHLVNPIRPVTVTRCRDGRYIIDFGVNRAGVTELRAKLPRGSRITMRHAEEIFGDRLDERTSRGAKQTDTYIAAGASFELYAPRFTYHGYRYVEISGLPADVDPMKSFVSWGVSADVREKATFRCSDETLNWLWDAARRSMRSNFMTYPSDCCMRSERTPCLMDSQVYEDAAFQIYDIAAFYSKWLYDAARYELAVDSKVGNNDNPDWAGDPITLSERFLTYCAATNVALREYVAMKRAADSFAARSKDGLWEKGFGDWCSPHCWEKPMPESTLSPALVNSALLCEDYRIMARLAELKGERDDAARYAALYDRTRTAFAAKFYDKKAKRFGSGYAVEQILSLKFGLVPAGAENDVTAALERRIREDHNHLEVGIYGNRYAGDVLLDAGLGELWLEAVRSSEWPSFGAMKEAGATSLWEQWTRNGPMNSHNHAMFAGVTSCFFTHLAGLRPAADGYSAILVKPCFPKGLDSLAATIELPCGKAEVSWKRVGDKVEYGIKLPKGVPVKCDLPANCKLMEMK